MKLHTVYDLISVKCSRTKYNQYKFSITITESNILQWDAIFLEKSIMHSAYYAVNHIANLQPCKTYLLYDTNISLKAKPEYRLRIAHYVPGKDIYINLKPEKDKIVSERVPDNEMSFNL
jgi:hypothetical protein